MREISQAVLGHTSKILAPLILNTLEKRGNSTKQ
jgi:hypothetical protein